MDSGSWLFLQDRGETVVVIGMRVGDKDGCHGFLQRCNLVGKRLCLGKHELRID
jgi:hypothetical protein